MSRLEILSLVLGGGVGLLYAGMIVVPGKIREGFRLFPRNRVAGWMMSALALFWASWHLYNMPLGRFDEYKTLLFVVAPVVYILVVICMDELLAARSLGALMILVPTPLLDAARWCDSAWRLVVVVLAYIIAIKGIFLVFSPYLFRKWIERFITSDERCRLFGVIGGAIMVIVIVLALTVY